MTRDDMEIVSALQVALADKVGQERFELWFGANTRLDLQGESLTVCVPNQFFQDWLRKNFREQIEASCEETLGRSVPVSFRIDPALIAAPAAPAKRVTAVSAAPAVAAPPEPAAERRRRFADLESFVAGPSNRLAHVAVQTVAARLGGSTPLVLFGPTGVGKTHLLEGLCTEVRRKHARCQAVYLSAEQYTTLFLGALHGSGLPSFRRKYRGLDLLVIDDIQFLAGKKATLVELLHTIDHFVREGRQLVFAVDRSPAELGDLGPELITRLQGGLACGLQAPDYDTRLGIVRQMAQRQQLAVPDEVLAYIAASFRAHARELAGALNRLHAASLALERQIDLAMAEESLGEMLRHGAKSVRLTDIEQAVCKVFGLEPKSLQSNRKGKQVSHPRMLAMWLARKHTRAALSEIGYYFGRRSHSTVISAQKKVNGWMSQHAALDANDAVWDIEDAIRRVEEALMAG